MLLLRRFVSLKRFRIETTAQKQPATPPLTHTHKQSPLLLTFVGSDWNANRFHLLWSSSFFITYTSLPSLVLIAKSYVTLPKLACLIPRRNQLRSVSNSAATIFNTKRNHRPERIDQIVHILQTYAHRAKRLHKNVTSEWTFETSRAR